MHLASFTGFTYWIRESLRIKLDTLHQVARKQLLDACQVRMAEATMPEVQSNGRVAVDEREVNSSTGMVSPTRKAAFEGPVFA